VNARPIGPLAPEDVAAVVLLRVTEGEVEMTVEPTAPSPGGTRLDWRAVVQLASTYGVNVAILCRTVPDPEEVARRLADGTVISAPWFLVLASVQASS